MHNPCFFFSYQDPFAFFRDPRVFHGYKEGKIEIHLVQFTDGTIHKSAKKAVVQLEPLEFYDTEFKTHIAIMGDYLVVLLARYIVPDGIVRTGKYQTRYLVNWVKGHVIEVRTPPTKFESFFEFPMSLVEIGLY